MCQLSLESKVLKLFSLMKQDHSTTLSVQNFVLKFGILNTQKEICERDHSTVLFAGIISSNPICKPMLNKPYFKKSKLALGTFKS
jgi:hypothetical protein